jgi:hypothetical protein
MSRRDSQLWPRLSRGSPVGRDLACVRGRRGSMRNRATQLILPFEPALPGRQLILAPRLWPTMTPTTQQQLGKRVGQLLRSMLAAADAGDLIGGHLGREVQASSGPGSPMKRSDGDRGAAEVFA